jgi:hypothetical protein
MIPVQRALYATVMDDYRGRQMQTNSGGVMDIFMRSSMPLKDFNQCYFYRDETGCLPSFAVSRALHR